MVLDIKVFDEQVKDRLISLIKLYFEEIENEVFEYDTAKVYIENVEKQLLKYPTLHFLVKETDHQIQGFLFGNTNYTYNNVDCAFILELYVTKECRLKGIGKQLVEEFEKLSDKLVYLTANKDAEKFYTSIGYNKTSLIDSDNGNQVFRK